MAGNGKSSEIDPLLAALIAKLPKGGSWPRADRVAWLELMAKSFDVVYGLEDAIDVPAFMRRELRISEDGTVTDGDGMPVPSIKRVTQLPRQGHAGHDFYIDPAGHARNSIGVHASMSDVPEDEMIFDYRPVTGDFRDTSSIVWADGARGTAGLPAGVSFCGPG